MQPAGSGLLLQATGTPQVAGSASILNNPAAKISTPASPGKGVYWVGADGNVYLKGAGGNGASVTNLGLSGNVKQSQLGGAYEINDPNPPKSPTAALTSSSSGTGYTDETSDIASNQAGLNALGAGLTTENNSINSKIGGIDALYAGDLGTAKNNYTTESQANTDDLQSNKEVALQNAVQGRQGLYGTLASLGALNGTGLVLANNAVAKGANEDLATAANNFSTNKDSLDTAYNTYTTEEQNAKKQADDAAATDLTQAKNSSLRTQQQYLSAIANDYTKEGNTAQAKNYFAQANALFDPINQTNVPATSDFGYTGSTWNTPSLNQITSKANNTSVLPTQGSGVFNVPGLVAVNKKQGS
jgi:hypothetical protein